MQFSSLGHEDDSEYNDDGFVEISELLAMQDAFVFGKESFNIV